MQPKATIIADSISPNGERLTTFELEYHRYIHSEVMTHRLFSRNAASSRAIPIDKIIEQVEANPAIPIVWGINQSGMQANKNHGIIASVACTWVWRKAAKAAAKSARLLQKLNVHKQLVNRILEPFQVMKTVVTATEFDNFFWLRCHKDAQPEIHALADAMYQEYMYNRPVKLGEGEWHTPYVGDGFWTPKVTNGLTLEEAQKVSSSCCAQVSYRKLDDSIEKATKIYDQLVTMTPVHASPFEHIGTPIPYESMQYSTEEGGCWEHDGITHMTIDGNLWSGNLKGWIQYRQLIPNNACWEYKG